MRFLIILFPLILLFTDNPPRTFREEQMNFTRVREAYSGKEKTVLKNLAENSLSRDSLQIYLRAFKTEKNH